MFIEWFFGIVVLENLFRFCGGEVIFFFLFLFSYFVVFNLLFLSCFKFLYENEIQCENEFCLDVKGLVLKFVDKKGDYRSWEGLLV